MFERCLVIDDHDVILDMMTVMLQRIGVKEIAVSQNGAEAIAEIVRFEPSIIISDLQMSPIDGIELLRLVRSGRYGLNPDTPIIILTSNASERIISECIRFNVDAFIVKPVQIDVLEARLTQLYASQKPKRAKDVYFDMYCAEPARTTIFDDEKVIDDAPVIEEETVISVHSPIVQDVSFSNMLAFEPSHHHEENTGGGEKQTRPSSKAYIKWQERFSLGHEELDESNKQLLDIINDTFHLIRNNGNQQAYEHVAVRFKDYMHNHLQKEEAILYRYNYKNAKRHQGMHQHLVRQAHTLLLKCQAAPHYYETDFLKFLRYWWVKHVVQEDAKYKDLFTESHQVDQRLPSS